MISPSAPRRLTLAARATALAGAQVDRVHARLAGLFPHTHIDILRVASGSPRRQTAHGARDRRGRSTPMEEALAEGRADLAVRSLKDVPANLPETFVIAAVGARDDPRDAWVSTRGARAGEIGEGVVGTSSLRRRAQLCERFPAIVVEPLVGDIGARIAALDTGRCQAIVVAAAGMKPLGYADRITELLDPAASLPAVGQGALALVCRADRPDLVELLAPFGDIATTLATAAERACLRAFAGGQRAALAAHAEWVGDTLWLRALVASADGREILRAEDEGVVDDAGSAEALGRSVADHLLARGASRLFAS